MNGDPEQDDMLIACTHDGVGDGGVTYRWFDLRRYETNAGVQYELGYVNADGASELHEIEQRGQPVCLTVRDTDTEDSITFEDIDWGERTYDECDPIVVIRTRETDPVPFIEEWLGDRDTYTVLDIVGTPQVQSEF